LSIGSNTGTLVFVNGSFDTGNYSVSAAAFQTSGTATKSVTLGSSTITLGGGSAWVFSTTTGLTFSAGTSTITLSAATQVFSGGGLTYYNVTQSSTASGTLTITGANTYNNLTFTSRAADGNRIVTFDSNQTISGALTLGAANTAVRRIQVGSDTIGTQRTLTLNGSLATLADVDFRDIKAAGSVATPWTGTRLGNAGNVSSITTASPKTVYWNAAGSLNWSSTGWATTNNGAPAANNFPLPQDTATFTEAGTAGTVTIDTNWWIGTIQMADGVSNRTTAFTLSTSGNQPNIHGNVTLFSSLTLSGTNTITFAGQGTTQTITSAGITWTQPITVNSPGGTVQLGDNLTQTSNSGFSLVAGTLNLNNKTLTCVLFGSNVSTTRAIAFGTGNITLTGNNATIWNTGTATNFTYTGTPIVNATYSGSTGTRTLAVHQSGGGSESNAISFNISAGSDTVAFSSSSYIKNLDYSGFSGTVAASTTNRFIYGNLKLSSTCTVATSNGGMSFLSSSGVQQITSNNVTIDQPITVNCGGTVALQDNFTTTASSGFTLTAGTVDLNNKTLTCVGWVSNNSNTRAIAFGTGQITLTGNNTTVLNLSNSTGFSYTGTPLFVSNYSGSTGTRNFRVTSGYTDSNVVSVAITAGSDTVNMFNGFKNVDYTGFTGTLANGATMVVYGDLKFSSGMTISGANAIWFYATSGTQKITANGQTFDFPISINAVGATVQPQDTFVMGATRNLTLANGTFDLNGKSVTLGTLSTSAGTKNITFNGSTLVIAGSGATAFNNANPTGFTTTAGTGTGVISMTSASAKTFVGGGSAYNCTLRNGGAGALTVTGSNTFTTIDNSVQPTTFTFESGSTQTVTNWSVSGTAGNLVTINATSTTPATLSKSSGTVTSNYLDLRYSTAAGGAFWYALNSVDSGNNTGWNIPNGNFFVFF
jgi:hypothetical protein